MDFVRVAPSVLLLSGADIWTMTKSLHLFLNWCFSNFSPKNSGTDDDNIIAQVYQNLPRA